MRCFYCNIDAEELRQPEHEYHQGPFEEYIKRYWYSYNDKLNTFSCNQCMVELDMFPIGWRSTWKAGKALFKEELAIQFDSERDMYLR